MFMRLLCAAWLGAASASAQEGPPAGPAVADISAVVSGAGATITWATDRPADGQVEFGPTDSYGSATPLDFTTATAHAVSLGALSPGALYHYRVLSRDSEGRVGASTDYTFSVPAAGAAVPSGDGPPAVLPTTAFALPAADAEKVPPTVLVMTPAPGSLISKTVAVSVNAADNVGVASVDFLLDGAAYGTALTSAPYAFQWDTLAISDGPHNLAAIARDASGNATTSVVPVLVRNLSPAAAAAAPAGPVSDDAAARAPQKLLSPARADGINDAAAFGPEAEQVEIFDVRGRRVFRASSPGPGSPIVWRARDGSGRVLESGIYLAMIVKRDGRKLNQSFSIAK